jgi:hypothetical protein
MKKVFFKTISSKLTAWLVEVPEHKYPLCKQFMFEPQELICARSPSNDCYCAEYKKTVNVAISNAIQFKEKDIEPLRILAYKQMFPNSGFIKADWPPEESKLYDFDLETEIINKTAHSASGSVYRLNSKLVRIVSEKAKAKQKTESQDELWESLWHIQGFPKTIEMEKIIKSEFHISRKEK